MTLRRRSGLTTIAIALVVACVSGCDGCDARRHVEAQPLDGGAPRPRTPTYPGPAICYVQAQRRTRLLDQQVFSLCQGAPSAGPVACFNVARSLLFTDAQRIALCRCAQDTEPVACVEFLDRETWLTDAEMLQLCSPTISGVLLSNCRPVGGY